MYTITFVRYIYIYIYIYIHIIYILLSIIYVSLSIICVLLCIICTLLSIVYYSCIIINIWYIIVYIMYIIIYYLCIVVYYLCISYILLSIISVLLSAVFVLLSQTHAHIYAHTHTCKHAYRLEDLCSQTKSSLTGSEIINLQRKLGLISLKLTNSSEQKTTNFHAQNSQFVKLTHVTTVKTQTELFLF